MTWPTHDRMCEAQVFSNDAPSATGSTVQVKCPSCPLKNTTVLNKEVDSPPGFYKFPAKRMRLDVLPKASTVIEKHWYCPEKFVLDPAWCVAEGCESKEAIYLNQREIRMLEAVYPHLSSIPDSPAEPQKQYKDVDESLIFQIPLISVEDEEEKTEDEAEKGTFDEQDCLLSVPASGGPYNHREGSIREMLTDSEKPVLHKLNAVKSGQGPARRDADPKIAAAVAAACMVVKSLEGRGLVDQELLVTLLRNPALIKSLTHSSQIPKDLMKQTTSLPVIESIGQSSASSFTATLSAVPISQGCLERPSISVIAAPHPNLSNSLLGNGARVSILAPHTHPSNRLLANGAQVFDGEHLNPTFHEGLYSANPDKLAGDPSVSLPNIILPNEGKVSEGGCLNLSSCVPSSLLPVLLESHSPVTSSRNVFQQGVRAEIHMHAWNQVASGAHDTSIAHDSVHMLPSFLDAEERTISHASGMNVQAQIRAPDFVKGPTQKPSVSGSVQPGQAIQMPTSYIQSHQKFGLQCEPHPPFMGLGINAVSYPKFLQENSVIRSFSKVASAKPKKHCLYFNTPKGCRNGMTCGFVHQSSNLEMQCNDMK